MSTYRSSTRRRVLALGAFVLPVYLAFGVVWASSTEATNGCLTHLDLLEADKVTAEQAAACV